MIIGHSSKVSLSVGRPFCGSCSNGCVVSIKICVLVCYVVFLNGKYFNQKKKKKKRKKEIVTQFINSGSPLYNNYLQIKPVKNYNIILLQLHFIFVLNSASSRYTYVNVYITTEHITIVVRSLGPGLPYDTIC